MIVVAGSPALAAGMPADTVKFDKETITLGGKKITVEMAKNDEQRQHGLMFRKSLPANEGMMFVFEDEQVRSFWMRNTLIDLSIGYFDKDKVLVDIQEMTPASPMDARPTTYPSAKPAMYALEMNKGWFAKNKIKTGQKFQFDRRRQ
jgi:uncharacterized membrane protein (UPF0127 family)